MHDHRNDRPLDVLALRVARAAAVTCLRLAEGSVVGNVAIVAEVIDASTGESHTGVYVPPGVVTPAALGLLEVGKFMLMVETGSIKPGPLWSDEGEQ